MKDRIKQAENRVTELVANNSIKKIKNYEHIATFYELKSLSRFRTGKLIFDNCTESYSDYSEVVAASYYAMYYIVHSFLAKAYKIKLREDTRGTHAITYNLVIYYLVKTNKIAKHLLNEYISTMDSASAVLGLDDFKDKAYSLARKYKTAKNSRESFTYSTTTVAEKRHALKALKASKEFIAVIREISIHPQKRTS